VGSSPVTRFALAAALALLAACSSTSGKEPRPAEDVYTDDAALTARVKSAIATDVGARAAGAVSVEAYRGTVQLGGFADSREQAQRAVEAAKKVSGVRAVKNDIRIKS
jgi:osmotically-inducible protein OsmY